MTRGIEIFTEMGKFSIAAKHHMTIAEMYEAEEPAQQNLEGALKHYETAADYYRGEEAQSSANKCLQKAALIYGTVEKYDKAAKIFEDLGRAAAENNLLRYGAKDHFFKAAVCHLCLDLLSAQQVTERYESLFPAFSDSRECKLLKKLMEAREKEDAEAFTAALNEYDQVTRLDPWLTTLLLRVKRSFEGLAALQ
jgi:alpha-soluble NSF attachment protein